MVDEIEYFAGEILPRQEKAGHILEEKDLDHRLESIMYAGKDVITGAVALPSHLYSSLTNKHRWQRIDKKYYNLGCALVLAAMLPVTKKISETYGSTFDIIAASQSTSLLVVAGKVALRRYFHKTQNVMAD